MSNRFFNSKSAQTLLSCILFALIFTQPKFGLAETWTSLRGNFTVEAKMLGLWGDSVILQMDDGRRVSVNLLDLRSESRIQAKKIAQQLEESRLARITELRTEATDSASPAPDPLPEPKPASSYAPPQANASASDFLNQMESALMSGHLIALYDFLPPSYRKDVDEVVKISASSMDPTAWASITGIVQQIGDLIVTRQRWFLSNPRIAGLGPAEQELFSGPFLTLAGLLRKGFDPAAMQIQNLQTGDFRPWLAERNAAVAPYLAQLFEQLDVTSAQQFNVESEENGVAVVNVSSGGIDTQVSYVQIEGYWVPKSLADTWAEEVTSMKESSGQIDTTMMASATLFLQPVKAVLTQLAAAPDAKSFHQQMESVFIPAQSLVTTFAGTLGNTFSAGQPGGGGQAGYDDFGMEMMDDEMEMEMEMMDEDMDMEMEMEMEMEEEGEGGIEMRGLGIGGAP